MNRKVVVIVLLAGMLVGCSGCLSSCFPNSEGGFLDYFTGNSLTRDKAAWEAERQRLAEQARKEEAKVDQLETQLAIEEEKSRRLQIEEDLVQAQARILELEAEIKRIEGDNYEKKAVAQALTRQSRAHVALQGVLVVVTIAALIVAGLALTWLLTSGRENG